MSDSVELRIARARQRLRSASSEAERRDALLHECDASLEAWIRAAHASTVAPHVRVARVRAGAQRIESAVQELLDLDPSERRPAVSAMRWLDDASQLAAVVATLRREIDDLDWIARCATLADPPALALAIEIAESSTVELPSLIATLYVLFGERGSAVFEDKARAVLAMVDEAGSGDEIAWMARVLLALPPDEARDSAIALGQTLIELERADPNFVEDLDDPSDGPATPVLLVLAHVGELAQASAMLDRVVERASEPSDRAQWVTPLRLRTYWRALQRFTAEAERDFAGRLGVASLVGDLGASVLDRCSAEERIAFDRASTEDDLRALVARSRSAPSASVLAQLGTTVRALVASASDAQRERWWSAVERGVERGLFEPSSMIALAPKGRVRAFVAQHADVLSDLRVLAITLRAMDPSEERAWLARTSIQRAADAPADEATEFAIATALDDDLAAERWLRARHPNGVPRGCLPPSLLIDAMNHGADRRAPSWWTDPPTPVLVAHARGFSLGRALLARCATAAIDAMFGADRDAVNKQRSSLADLLRFADAQAVDRAIALQERLGEWWLGHALIVRCKELQTSGALAIEALRAAAARLRRTLGFVPRGTLTMALIELAASAERSLDELVPEPPLDRTRWELTAEARAFSVADAMFAWGASLATREAVEHASRLWPLVSDEAKDKASPWITASYRSLRTTATPCDPEIVAWLPVETIAELWARFGAGTSLLAPLLHPAELRRLGGASLIDAVTERTLAAIDAL